jgi:hypothetical protein
MTTKVMEQNIELESINSPRVRGLKPFNRWCGENGITRATGWRWRRDGVINTINIYGRQYVTRDEEERFLRRAAQGEFHRDPHAPVAAKETHVDV